MEYVEKPVCKVGDVYYRVIKGLILEVVITKVEQMKLGHYVYKDNTGRTYFNRNFGNYIFKTREEAEKSLKRKAQEVISELKKVSKPSFCKVVKNT